MSETKDLYAILGVLPDAEPEVIRAVYLALAKKYHPDSSGSSENEEKFKEINAAYEVLSDLEQRREYDATRSDENGDTGQYEPGVDDEDLSVDDYQDDWEFAVEYCPQLSRLLNEVATISPTLSIVFQSTILTNKAFDDAEKVKNLLIRAFMERYFGSSIIIQDFAKLLLHKKEMNAAKELNKAVRILGDYIKPRELILKINQKYGLNTDETTYRGFFISKDNNVFKVFDKNGNKVKGLSSFGTIEAAKIYIENHC